MIECRGNEDGEEVGGDVFEGEEAAQEDFSGEGEAEGVNWGQRDEATELEDDGDEDGECCDGSCAASGEKCGKEPVEGYGPEEGAEVFVEEPWQAQGEQTHGQANRYGDDEQERAD